MSETQPLIDLKKLEERNHKHNLSISKRPILTALYLGSFLASLDNTVVANMMETVSNEFHESEKKQYIATSFLLTNTAFQPLYGKLSDLIGRKPALLIALTFFWVGCTITMFANSVTQFSIGRFICGMGCGGVNSLSSVIVSDICDARMRGIMQGYSNLVFAAGQFLGAPIGGLIIDTIGWRYVFGLQVPLVIICQFLVYNNVNIKLAHVPKHGKYAWAHLKRLDIGGTFTLTCTIGSLLILSSDDGMLSAFSKHMLYLAGLIFGILFFLTEFFWASERLIPFEVLLGKTGVVSVIIVISSFVIFGDMFRKPLYLQLMQNFSPADCGVFTIFTSLAAPVASFVTGFITKHTKKSVEYVCYELCLFAVTLQLTGFLLECILVDYLKPKLGLDSAVTSLELYNLLDTDKFFWKVLLVITSLMCGYGYCTVLVATLVVVVFTVDKSQQGTVTGLFYLWRSLGTVIGTSFILTTYQKVLNKKLFNYIVLKLGSLENYEKIIHDSSQVRMLYKDDIKITEKLLTIFNQSFVISYIPQIVILLLTVVMTFLFVVEMKKSLDTDVEDDKNGESP